jgi:septal ring factor EnvC (AmiA/AmiB activator)
VQAQRLHAMRAALAAEGAAARAQAARNSGHLDEARRRAAADAARASALSQATVAAASRVQDTERNAADAAEQTRTLAEQQNSARTALQEAAAALAPMLPAIERLSLFPSETLLASPAGAEDSVTGLMVLRGLGGALEQRARALRDAQARLASLSAQLVAEQGRLLALQQRQADQQAQLAAQTEAAQATQRASRAEADQAARSAAASAARAATLGDAVARIEAAERAAQQRFLQQAQEAESASRPAAAQQARQGAASLARPAGPGLQPGASGSAPVAGRMVQDFGVHTDTGTATGVTYAPPSLATVTAPCAGRVDFSGPFRSYGRMLILDCGRDYRFVLAGLDRLDVAVGQNLARGAAIGRMPAWNEAAASGGRPSLYVQLRHGDATIDPGRFLQRPR